MELPLKTPSTVEEKNAIKLDRQKQLNLAKDLFAEADKITVETSQRKICELLAKTSEYLLNNKYFLFEVKHLHIKLSKCIECKCNEQTWGFDDLKGYIKSITEKLF